MNDSVKVAGLCCTMLGFISCLALGYIELAYANIGGFGALIGFPIVGKLRIK